MRRILALAVCLSFLTIPARAAGDRRCIALTFDDGPSGKYTRQLLEGLYDRGVQATFLLCGYRLADYPDLAQEIFQKGHEIGFHGYSHNPMKTMSRRQIAQELMDTQALLPEGCKPVFLRPPGGFSSDAVVQVAQARGLALLHWSVDPKDWAVKDAAAIERTVLRQVKDGDIILLHDMSSSSVQAALNIIDALQKQDYTFVTVSELARLRGIRPKPGTVYQRFPREDEQK